MANNCRLPSKSLCLYRRRMIFTLALVATASLGNLTMPVSMRGVWDLPNRCKNSLDYNETRVVVRETEAVFMETTFTPERILIANPQNWTADGEFYYGGEGSKGRLNLRLSPDGKTLSYTGYANRVYKMVRCSNLPKK